ncbi:MAG: class I SAM-dependent methyltransferase [Pirellulales bacterium]|nr:class I SAM-dependent methyltransferase [Pirellulales bacterium]
MDQARECPLCGSDRANIVYRRPRDGRSDGFWTLVSCTNCGMVYLRERIDYSLQREEFDWADTFPAQRQRRRKTSGNIFRRLRRRLRAERSLKTMAVISRHKSGGRLCDFGCGTGKLLAHAVEDFSAVGIDISPRQAEGARQRVPDASIVVAPVVETNLQHASFDVVTMQSFIEHESNPMAALRAAWNLLKPGGVLVIKTPNHNCWNRYLRGDRWCGYRFPDHCNYYTMETLAASTLRAGFRILPGHARDRLPFSDNMYLAVEKPAVIKFASDKVHSAERSGLRNRCSAELSHLC